MADCDLSSLAIELNGRLYICNIEARLFNYFCSAKEIIIIYFECFFVDSVIHHAMRLRLIASSGVAYLVLPHFPHYLIKVIILLKKNY